MLSAKSHRHDNITTLDKNATDMGKIVCYHAVCLDKYFYEARDQASNIQNQDSKNNVSRRDSVLKLPITGFYQTNC